MWERVLSELVTLWLLPAALEDYRTLRVSLVWTLPLFAAGIVGGIVRGTFPVVMAVLMSFLIAFRLGWAGGADGKVAVGLAGLMPEALVIGYVVLVLTFLVMRLRRRDFALRVRGAGGVHVPAVTCMYVGCVLAVLGQGMGWG